MNDDIAELNKLKMKRRIEIFRQKAVLEEVEDFEEDEIADVFDVGQVIANAQDADLVGTERMLASDDNRLIEVDEDCLADQEVPDYSDLSRVISNDVTYHGTPRKYRPRRYKDDAASDSSDDRFAETVKLGARIPLELKERFIACARAQGVTQTIALTEALDFYIKRFSCRSSGLDLTVTGFNVVSVRSSLT